MYLYICVLILYNVQFAVNSAYWAYEDKDRYPDINGKLQTVL